MNYIGGYCGNSMSNRAVMAYESGLMPKSKWTKAVILDKINECNPNLVTYASKLTREQLFNMFCNYSEWHHTSSAYNVTYFYEFNESLAMDMTADKLPKREVIKKAKDDSPNLYVTAYVEYKISVKKRGGWRSETVTEIVKYRSKDKMCRTLNGNKRISCMNIIDSIEQKTRWNDGKKFKKIKEF